MKLYIFACVLAAAFAEPPRFRQARFRFQRQELAPTTTDNPLDTTTESGPYPPSGWKPAAPFELPKQETPADTYGAPQNAPYPPSGWKPDQPFSLPNEQPPATNYGVPDNSYGVPDNSYGPPDVETKEETTENPQSEKIEGPVDLQQSAGQYYILLPNGQLQMVGFAAANNGKNQKLRLRSAPLRVRNNGAVILLRS